jgi:protein TonB
METIYQESPADYAAEIAQEAAVAGEAEWQELLRKTVEAQEQTAQQYVQTTLCAEYKEACAARRNLTVVEEARTRDVPVMLQFIADRERENFGWSPYSFVQMKRFKTKAALVGFLVAMALSSIVIGGYFAWFLAKVEAESKRKVNISKILLSQLPPPPLADAPPVVAPPPVVESHGPAARAGTPVPVPDVLVAPDVKEFANIDQISRASSKGGDGVDLGYLGIANEEVSVEVREKEEIPDMYEFVSVEKEPYLDIRDLQSRVEYPEIARRANIQGKVLVRVLVGKDGIPKKSIVEMSDSELLEPAAVKAIMKSVFTPAVQNNQPVACWVSIPVLFVIR